MYSHLSQNGAEWMRVSLWMPPRGEWMYWQPHQCWEQVNRCCLQDLLALFIEGHVEVDIKPILTHNTCCTQCVRMQRLHLKCLENRLPQYMIQNLITGPHVQILISMHWNESHLVTHTHTHTLLPVTTSSSCLSRWIYIQPPVFPISHQFRIFPQ